ncbi:hypothetical protein BLNAU_20908 [Blattamonas nauphoetae]|uniref:Uncharacterized protein n=1 Tax=Blattamonas nauphoetae TaxID=2049346 RepID=A0ABQ9WXC7_9EUKA|nr:hypothetical protein BLNAU_20908 [Blattamonas nauphoetae]
MSQKTCLPTLFPFEVALRPVPFKQPLMALLSSCSEALRTEISFHTASISLYELYPALVNVMYHNPAFRAVCLPKCIEILDSLRVKLDDKRIHTSTVLTQLYPSPYGNLDPLLDSLTLLMQLSTPSQMHTILRFFISLGGVELKTPYQWTSHKWFIPFFLRIVDFGLHHACENDQARIVDEIKFCLSLDYDTPTKEPIKANLAHSIVSYSEDHRDLFLSLRRTISQPDMSSLKRSMFRLTEQFQNACEVLRISSTLFSVEADSLFLTLGMLDSNDDFRQEIHSYLFRKSRQNKITKRALRSSGWEDVLELDF